MASNIHVNEQPNILIVDDISTNLVILSEMIKQTGCIPRPAFYTALEEFNNG